jgi:hypothetical protein
MFNIAQREDSQSESSDIKNINLHKFHCQMCKRSIPCHRAEQKERLTYKHMKLDTKTSNFFSREVLQALQIGLQVNSILIDNKEITRYKFTKNEKKR